jgi:hypothetical protein
VTSPRLFCDRLTSTAARPEAERNRRFEQLDNELRATRTKALHLEQKEHGALIGIGHCGTLEARLSLVRPKDKKALKQSRKRDSDGRDENH